MLPEHWMHERKKERKEGRKGKKGRKGRKEERKNLGTDLNPPQKLTWNGAET